MCESPSGPLYDLRHPGRCGVASHCGCGWHFPDDECFRVSFPVLIWHPLDEVSVQIFCLILDFFPLCFEDLLCILETNQKCDVQLLLWTFFCKPLNFWRKDRMKFVLPWARQKVFTYNTKSIIHKIKTNNWGSVESKPFWRVFLVLAWLR